MIDKLKQQPSSSYLEGGLRLLLDGYDGWIPDYDETVTPIDILTILALVLFCCMTLSCIFSTSGMTAIDNGVVVVNNNDDNNEELLPGRYRHGLRLLNREEVLSLPEVVFGLEKVMILEENKCAGMDMGGGKSTGMDMDDGEESIEAVVSVTDMQHCCNTSTSHISLVSLHESDDNGSIESMISMSNSSHTANADGNSQSRLTSPIARSATAALTPPSPCEDVNEPFHDITCTICLEDYVAGEKLRVLPCQHAFHTDCILPWLTERAPTCPLCKALMEVVREGDELHRQSEEDEQTEQDGAVDGATTTIGEGQEHRLSTIMSGDGEDDGNGVGNGEDDFEQNEQEQSNRTPSAWRTLYNSFRAGRSTQQQQDQQEEELGLQTQNQQGEVNPTPIIQNESTASSQQDRRSLFPMSLTPRWRFMFEQSRSNNSIELSIEENPQNQLGSMRQPLLNNGENGEENSNTYPEIV